MAKGTYFGGGVELYFGPGRWGRFSKVYPRRMNVAYKRERDKNFVVFAFWENGCRVFCGRSLAKVGKIREVFAKVVCIIFGSYD